MATLHMLKFMKDLVNCEPIYRNLPLAASVTFTSGCAVALDTTAATTDLILQVSTWINNVGVFYGYATKGTDNASSVVTTGTVALGTTQYGKVLINPFAIYEAQYEAESYVTTTAFSGTTWTATHEGAAGDWLLNSTTTSAAYGELLYVASTSTTTTMTTLSTATVTPGQTDNWIHIRRNLCGQLAAQYGRIDLNATATAIKSAASYGGVGMQIIDNFVRSDRSTSYQPLRRATHDNTQDKTYKVYAELQFVDTIWTKI